jgi:hypothetical protein
MLKEAVDNDSLLPQTFSINLTWLLYTKDIRLESLSVCFCSHYVLFRNVEATLTVSQFSFLESPFTTHRTSPWLFTRILT